MSKLVALTGKYGKGKFAIVDDDDYEKVILFIWRVNDQGYVNTSIVSNNKKRQISLHRFIMNVDDPKLEVDHIHHNLLDNRKSELRICSHEENCRNRQNILGYSKYHGVYWHAANQKWIASITVKYKKRMLGSFDDEEIAAKAYDQAARQYHVEFATLNFPNCDNYIDVNSYLSRQNKPTSKYRGVSWKKHANKWLARLSYRQNNKRMEKYIGYFSDEILAAKAYDKALRENIHLYNYQPKFNFPENK